MASIFNSQPQITLKAENNKAFDESCLITTFEIKSGNIADCLEHCLENCRCQSFQICHETKCQLCSSHKEENSSLLRDKEGCVYATYEMRQSTNTIPVICRIFVIFYCVLHVSRKFFKYFLIIIFTIKPSNHITFFILAIGRPMFRHGLFDEIQLLSTIRSLSQEQNMQTIQLPPTTLETFHLRVPGWLPWRQLRQANHPILWLVFRCSPRIGYVQSHGLGRARV